ncbi:MAG: hypothetical protein ABR999_10865 [Methanoregula sp.]|jgi:hypothetical protein|uniref:hypothetical protein n=1 Tax=Methanoregula sp. TaxID=2052170 RepID=UPI003D123617
MTNTGDYQADWFGKPVYHIAQTQNKIVRVKPEAADLFYADEINSGRHIAELQIAYRGLKYLGGKEVPVLGTIMDGNKMPAHIVPIVPTLYLPGGTFCRRAFVAAQYTERVTDGFMEAS